MTKTNKKNKTIIKQSGEMKKSRVQMENLKKLRIEANITQSQIADDLGILQSTYSNYENNKYETDIPTLLKIADYFDISMDYLCNRKYSSKIGYIPKDKVDLVAEVISLDEAQAKKVEAFVEGLKSINKD